MLKWLSFIVVLSGTGCSVIGLGEAPYSDEFAELMGENLRDVSFGNMLDLGRVDDRLTRGGSTEYWLESLGHLAHAEGRCTAQLISGHHGGSTRLALTAWHCVALAGKYNLPLGLSFYSNRAKVIDGNAKVLASGGSLENDWALLEIDRWVSSDTVAPIVVNSETIATLGVVKKEIAAGYSLGEETGMFHLYYDENCKGIVAESSDIVSSYTTHVESVDCLVEEGSSGGPYVLSYEEQASVSLVGIISLSDEAGYVSYFALSNIIEMIESEYYGVYTSTSPDKAIFQELVN